MKPLIKQLSNIPNSKHFYPLMLFSAIALFIWFCGPQIAIADAVPLAEPEKRFYTILAVFLAWVLKINFLDGNSQQTNTTTPMSFINPELSKKLQAIESRFQGAMRFLKKTMIDKQGKNVSLYHLPWYLLIGPSQSGKTTMLANANINFILAKQFKNENLRNIPPSDVCDWWVTRDAVMLDVPSSYLFAKQKNMSANAEQQKSTSTNGLWQNFLLLLKKYRGKKALTGVVLTLALPDLMSSQNKERALAELKQRIAELREQFGSHLPFYLTITKCDQLSGFADFFSDSGSDELSQAWGVTLPQTKENESLAEVFTHRFNALIKRLNKQLIWRLHQERNPFTRPQIKDFPLQVERLKENIINTIKILAPEAGFNLQGVYLTSSMQQVAEEQQTTHLQAASMSTGALQIMRNPVMPSRAYFVRQLLLQALLIPVDHSNAVSRISFSLDWRKNPKIYAVSVCAAVLMGGFLANELRTSIKQTYAIRDGLAAYQVDVQQASQQTPHLAKALTLMNALQQTAAGNTLLPYTDRAQQSAAAAYQQALKTIVLPEIRYDLESYLAATNNKNPETLYIALKAYLMLGPGQHLQPDFVFNTLQQINPELFNKQNSAELNSHIHAALNTAWQPMDLDDMLVSRARKRLTNLAPLDLSYTMVKSIPAYNLKNTISVEVNPDKDNALLNKEISYQVPKMFTADSFQDIYDRQIVAAAREVTQGSWVLGGAATAPGTEALTEQLRNLYVANYITAWENILANVQLLNPNTLAEIDAQLVSLAHDNSPLLQLLIAVKENTSFTAITNASPKLAAIDTFVAGSGTQPNTALYKTFVALNQAHAGLKSLLESSDKSETADKIATGRMKNPQTSTDFITVLFNTAEATPAPLKYWLNNLAAKSWHLVLQDSAVFIEQHWESGVLATYNAQLANRYPFANDANKEVTLDQFTKFLGTHGTVSSFYQNYLQPFIDSSPKGWAWKKINNDQIPFSKTALSSLEHAAELQHTFFPNEDNHLAIKFTLQPIALESDLKSFQININGQASQYEHGGAPVPQAMNWPGEKNVRATSLNFLASKNPPASVNLNTDWSWFRLINKSTQKIISSKQLLVTFELNGHKAKYYLFTQTHLNPFIPINMQNFRLPQQLGEEA